VQRTHLAARWSCFANILFYVAVWLKYTASFGVMTDSLKCPASCCCFWCSDNPLYWQTAVVSGAMTTGCTGKLLLFLMQ
jgi:hypothetical protein